MKQTVETSIIVAVRNNQHWTYKCLESIKSHTCLKSNELIIIDNGSNETVGEFLDKLVQKWTSEGLNCRLKSFSDNNGSYFAWNEGIRLSQGSYVCIMHNDCIVTSNWLQPLLDALNDPDQEEEIGIVSPCTNYVDENEYLASEELMKKYVDSKIQNKETIRPHHIDSFFNKVYPEGLEKIAEKVRDIHKKPYRFTTQIATFCFLTKKNLFDRFGYFDDDFFPHLYGEKILKHHMDAKGVYSLCVYGSFVQHNGNTTTDGIEFVYEMVSEQNKELFQQKMKDIYAKHMEKPYKKKDRIRNPFRD